VPMVWIEDPKDGAVRSFDDIVRDVLVFTYGKYETVRGAAHALRIPKSTFSEWCRRLGVPLRERGRPSTRARSRIARGASRAIGRTQNLEQRSIG
jgi:hypothetical protein